MGTTQGTSDLSSKKAKLQGHNTPKPQEGVGAWLGVFSLGKQTQSEMAPQATVLP